MGGGSCGEGVCAIPTTTMTGGGGGGGGGGKKTRKQKRGGGCSCGLFRRGGSRGGRYKPTRKNRATYRRYKRGESIGFTATSHLKAIGMIPRTSRKHYGKRVVSNKYK